MRMFSWAGAFTLTAAVGVGYLACEIVHSADPLPCTQFVAAEGGELCENQPHITIPPQVIEEIDLSCTQTLPYAFAPQTNEPPLADAKSTSAVIQLASYEVPASSPDDCEFQIMPYLTDDAAPAKLPNFMDVPVIVPIPVTPPDVKPNTSDPLFQMVSRFVNDGATWPPRQKPDTTEVRPGDLPPKSGGDSY